MRIRIRHLERVVAVTRWTKVDNILPAGVATVPHGFVYHTAHIEGKALLYAICNGQA